jgi:hypothetical protein
MSYPVNLLLTIADCDLVLADAAVERIEIEYRHSQLQRLHTLGNGNASKLSAELSSKTREYNNLTIALAAMPEGPDKSKELIEYKRLDYLISKMNDQQATGVNGAVMQFKRTFEVNCLAEALTENATLATEVGNRRTAWLTPPA